MTESKTTGPDSVERDTEDCVERDADDSVEKRHWRYRVATCAELRRYSVASCPEHMCKPDTTITRWMQCVVLYSVDSWTEVGGCSWYNCADNL